MGGNIGCSCTENRHDAAAAADAEAMSAKATMSERSSAGPVDLHSFSNATPRSVKGTVADLANRRQAAQSWLVAVCKKGDLDAIQNAIVWAKDVGVSQAEIDDATATATRLSAARRRARDALARAVLERDETALREAVSMADEAGIDTSELEEAVELIEELEKSGTSTCRSDEDIRRQALAALEKAMGSRGQQELQKAIAEAERVGLGTKSERSALAQARVMLKIINARKEAAQKRRAQDAIEQTPCGANAA